MKAGNYVLRNLERKDDDSFWKDALPKLCEYFDGVGNEGTILPLSSILHFLDLSLFELIVVVVTNLA